MSEHDPTEYVLNRLIEALAECYEANIPVTNTRNLEQLCDTMFIKWIRGA